MIAASVAWDIIAGLEAWLAVCRQAEKRRQEGVALEAIEQGLLQLHETGGLHEDGLLPLILDWDEYRRIAAAVDQFRETRRYVALDTIERGLANYRKRLERVVRFEIGRRPGRPRGTGKVTAAVLKRIRRLARGGKSKAEIAERVGLTRQTVYTILKNKV